MSQYNSLKAVLHQGNNWKHVPIMRRCQQVENQATLFVRLQISALNV
jgi:hypothetical protein